MTRTLNYCFPRRCTPSKQILFVPLTPTEIMKKICSVIQPPIDENNSAVKGATYFLNDPKTKRDFRTSFKLSCNVHKFVRVRSLDKTAH